MCIEGPGTAGLWIDVILPILAEGSSWQWARRSWKKLHFFQHSQWEALGEAWKGAVFHKYHDYISTIWAHQTCYFTACQTSISNTQKYLNSGIIYISYLHRFFHTVTLAWSKIIFWNYMLFQVARSNRWWFSLILTFKAMGWFNNWRSPKLISNSFVEKHRSLLGVLF